MKLLFPHQSVLRLFLFRAAGLPLATEQIGVRADVLGTLILERSMSSRASLSLQILDDGLGRRLLQERFIFDLIQNRTELLIIQNIGHFQKLSLFEKWGQTSTFLEQVLFKKQIFVFVNDVTFFINQETFEVAECAVVINERSIRLLFQNWPPIRISFEITTDWQIAQ